VRAGAAVLEQPAHEFCDCFADVLLLAVPSAALGGTASNGAQARIRMNGHLENGHLESCRLSVIYSLAKSASTLNRLLNAFFLKIMFSEKHMERRCEEEWT
jgi:hypothetical protein